MKMAAANKPRGFSPKKHLACHQSILAYFMQKWDTIPRRISWGNPVQKIETKTGARHPMATRNTQSVGCAKTTTVRGDYLAIAAAIFFGATVLLDASASQAGDVAVKLTNGKGVTLVGAIQRWDEDGNHRKIPDTQAKINAPAVDVRAEDKGNGRWIFKKLPPGIYDLVILADHRRFEGFQYAPIKEFDPFLPPSGVVEEDASDFILDDIKSSQHYENKIEPLYLSGNKKIVRILVMLIRDKPTTYTDVPNAATIRHELWQYTWNYGGWQKEKRTKVMDRILMPREELRKWTWLWDIKLGGLEVGNTPMHFKYTLPTSSDKELKGLYPY
jgi:hypothetical protein